MFTECFVSRTEGQKKLTSLTSGSYAIFLANSNTSHFLYLFCQCTRTTKTQCAQTHSQQCVQTSISKLPGLENNIFFAWFLYVSFPLEVQGSEHCIHCIIPPPHSNNSSVHISPTHSGIQCIEKYLECK